MTKNYTASTTIKYSPQKARLVLDAIRRVSLDKALDYLSVMRKGQTKKFYDLLRSAANNLSIVEADYDKYLIDTIVAEQADKLYRVQPRAKGSAFRIARRTSRIKVKLLAKG